MYKIIHGGHQETSQFHLEATYGVNYEQWIPGQKINLHKEDQVTSSPYTTGRTSRS